MGCYPAECSRSSENTWQTAMPGRAGIELLGRVFIMTYCICIMRWINPEEQQEGENGWDMGSHLVMFLPGAFPSSSCGSFREPGSKRRRCLKAKTECLPTTNKFYSQHSLACMHSDRCTHTAQPACLPACHTEPPGRKYQRLKF